MKVWINTFWILINMIMNNKEKDYSNLDKSFAEETSDIENRYKNTEEVISKIYSTKSGKNKSKAMRVSVSLPEDDINFVSYIRSLVTEPGNKFYPSTSDIYRAGISKLKELNKDEITKLIKSFS